MDRLRWWPNPTFIALFLSLVFCLLASPRHPHFWQYLICCSSLQNTIRIYDSFLYNSSNIPILFETFYLAASSPLFYPTWLSSTSPLLSTRDQCSFFSFLQFIALWNNIRLIKPNPQPVPKPKIIMHARSNHDHRGMLADISDFEVIKFDAGFWLIEFGHHLCRFIFFIYIITMILFIS